MPFDTGALIDTNGGPSRARESGAEESGGEESEKTALVVRKLRRKLECVRRPFMMVWWSLLCFHLLQLIEETELLAVTLCGNTFLGTDTGL